MMERMTIGDCMYEVGMQRAWLGYFGNITTQLLVLVKSEQSG